MNKKITIVVSSITTAFFLSGCTPTKPISAANHVIYQTGPSAKLGIVHRCTKYQHHRCHH